MAKNSTLENLKEKIKGYSALAGALIATSGAANADIIAVDSSVTLTNEGDEFEIDLNCDGVMDARFTFKRNKIVNGVDFSYYDYSSSNPKEEFYSFRTASLTLLGGASVVSSSVGSNSFVGGIFKPGDDIGTNVPSSAGDGWNSNTTGQIARARTYYTFFAYRDESLPSWATGATSYVSTGTSNSAVYGNWANQAINRYMGLRMETAPGEFYYGWVKVRTLSSGGDNKPFWSMQITGYALNETVNEPIKAGIENGYADSAFAVIAYDTADNDNSSDLAVSFQLDQFAFNTGDLRLFAVPAGQDTLDVCEDAWGILKTTDYATVAVGSTDTLTGDTLEYYADFAGVNDINGDPIVNGEEYFVYVYSKGSYDVVTNVAGANKSVLIKSSNSVTLLGIAEPVEMLVATDSTDNDDASDLVVTFNESADASKQSEYRVFVVKEDKAGSFNLDTANTIAMGNYKTVASTGDGVAKVVNYAIGDTDTDGDAIMVCTPYQVFIQSVANGTKADRDSIITDSLIVELKDIAGTVKDLTGSDVDDFLSGRDFSYRFVKPDDIEGITHFWVIAVPTADMPITAEEAQQTEPIRRRTIAVGDSTDNGGIYSGNFGPLRDYNGNAITNGTEYSLVVLSVVDGVCHDRSDLVVADETVTLRTIIPESVDNLTIIAEDVADDRSPSDMEVTFEAPANTEGIGGYYVIVVNKDFAQNFVVNEAVGTAMVRSLGYATTYVEEDGSTSYTTRLDPIHADENGSLIQNYKSYYVYILSEGDQIDSYTNTLSDSSNSVILRDYTGFDNDENELAGKVNINSFSGNIRVLVDPTLNSNGEVFVHNAVGQVIRSEDINNRELLINDLQERGIYFVTVVLGDKKITKKVFIE